MAGITILPPEENWVTALVKGIGEGAKNFSSGLQSILDMQIEEKLLQKKHEFKQKQAKQEFNELYEGAVGMGMSPKEATFFASLGRSGAAKLFPQLASRGFQPGYTEQPMAAQQGAQMAKGPQGLDLLSQLQGQGVSQAERFLPSAQLFGQQGGLRVLQEMGQQEQPSRGYTLPGEYKPTGSLLEAAKRQAPISPDKAAQLAQAERHHESDKLLKDEKFAYDIHKDYIKATKGAEKSVLEENNILNRIIDISEHGEVRDPFLSETLSKLGLNFQSLQNADTLELNKLQSWFLRGGPALFGGKVSNFEAQQILNATPSLFHSKEGRVRLAKQMLIRNKEVAKEAEMMRKAIKKNNGNIPKDLDDRVNKLMEPYRKKFAKEFVNASHAEDFPSPKTFPEKKVIRDPISGLIWKPNEDKSGWEIVQLPKKGE